MLSEAQLPSLISGQVLVFLLHSSLCCMHFVNSEDFWDIDSNFHAFYLYYYYFFLPLVFLGFLTYLGSEPLASDSQTR